MDGYARGGNAKGGRMTRAMLSDIYGRFEAARINKEGLVLDASHVALVAAHLRGLESGLVTPRERPKKRRNDGWHLKVGQIGVFVSVGWYEDGAPMELFLDVSAIGSQLRGEFQLIAKLVSHAWQHGQAVNEACVQMQEVSYYSPGAYASGHETLLGRPVKSILEAVGLVLEHEFKARGLWKA